MSNVIEYSLKHTSKAFSFYASLKYHCRFPIYYFTTQTPKKQLYGPSLTIQTPVDKHCSSGSLTNNIEKYQGKIFKYENSFLLGRPYNLVDAKSGAKIINCGIAFLFKYHSCSIIALIIPLSATTFIFSFAITFEKEIVEIGAINTPHSRLSSNLTPNYRPILLDKLNSEQGQTLMANDILRIIMNVGRTINRNGTKFEETNCCVFTVILYVTRHFTYKTSIKYVCMYVCLRVFKYLYTHVVLRESVRLCVIQEVVVLVYPSEKRLLLLVIKITKMVICMRTFV